MTSCGIYRNVSPRWLHKPLEHLCVFSTQEPMDVVELFGLKGVQHTPISIKNARVSQVDEQSTPVHTEQFITCFHQTLCFHCVHRSAPRKTKVCRGAAGGLCNFIVKVNSLSRLSVAALQGESDCNLQPSPSESSTKHRL